MLRENYYIRETHMDIADAVIRSSVNEEMPFVDNHIIIIGKALSNLYDLIRPLRSRTLGELKHIIIIYPNDFPTAVWQRISIFESVWIVRGSALEEADIRRAGTHQSCLQGSTPCAVADHLLSTHTSLLLQASSKRSRWWCWRTPPR
jgi:hypothetical protein